MEWQKWTKSLPNKPEVVQMAARLGLDNYSVAGRLMGVWGWVDENSENGCSVFGATDVALSALIVRIAGVPNFAKAMEEVGWLKLFPDHAEFPNGDRHNGKTAKKRAKQQERMRDYRARSRDVSVAQKALPEKRREDIYHPLPPPVVKKRRAAGGEKDEKPKALLHYLTEEASKDPTAKRPTALAKYRANMGEYPRLPPSDRLLAWIRAGQVESIAGITIEPAAKVTHNSQGIYVDGQLTIPAASMTWEAIKMR